jgi:hypothetical protein
VYLVSEARHKNGFVTAVDSFPIDEDAWEKVLDALDACRLGAR